MLATAAAHWSERVAKPATPMSRWWHSAQIKRHVNRLICGEALEGMSAGHIRVLSRISGGKSFGRAISIGCGSASKEISLLRSGIADRFVLHEISGQRMGVARETARRFGLESRIDFRCLALDFDRPSEEKYDLIYWNNSLHHMLDVQACLAWCRRALSPSGILYMNDFVGPTHMQWPDEMLDVANLIRGSLSPRYLRSVDGTSLLRAAIARPSREKLIARDPTECADSGNIVPALHRNFPRVLVKPTGGG